MPRAQIVLIGTIATTDIARETWKGSGLHREVTSDGKVYREVSFNVSLMAVQGIRAFYLHPAHIGWGSCGMPSLRRCLLANWPRVSVGNWASLSRICTRWPAWSSWPTSSASGMDTPSMFRSRRPGIGFVLHKEIRIHPTLTL